MTKEAKKVYFYCGNEERQYLKERAFQAWGNKGYVVDQMEEADQIFIVRSTIGQEQVEDLEEVIRMAESKGLHVQEVDLDLINKDIYEKIYEMLYRESLREKRKPKLRSRKV